MKSALACWHMRFMKKDQKKSGEQLPYVVVEGFLEGRLLGLKLRWPNPRPYSFGLQLNCTERDSILEFIQNQGVV